MIIGSNLDLYYERTILPMEHQLVDSQSTWQYLSYFQLMIEFIYVIGAKYCPTASHVIFKTNSCPLAANKT